jgi:cytochrome P450
MYSRFSAEIPTFLVAGHETTATLLSWILYRLCLRADVQSALRAECLENPLPTSAQGNEPLDQMELTAFDKLPLLDAVIRETLRLHAPVSDTVRSAIKDDILPLSKPFVAVNGKVQDTVPISQGDTVVVPVAIINRSEELWGPDAKEWKFVLFLRRMS